MRALDSWPAKGLPYDPMAWLVDRGRTWTVLIPLATSVVLVGMIQPLVYPLAFGVTLVALLAEPADGLNWSPVAGLRVRVNRPG